jgi:Putative heavy-metal-binding
LGFFNRNDDEDTDRAQSLERIESGGIPLGAERRLQELAAPGALYTSGLSVNEFALLRRMGPEPLAQVMGASVIRTGYQYLPPLPPGEIVTQTSGGLGTWSSQSPGYVNQFTEPSMSQLRSYRWHATEVCELDVLTDAWRTARRRALDRISEEALQVNADAVVGVRLHRSEHDLGQGTIEYVVTGTAVRLPGSTAANWPVLTDLSVQDYWRLVQAGQEPVGLVATTTVMFASAPVALRVQRLRTLQQNQELEELSKAFRLARETVRAQIEGQVSDAHGAGAVGVTMSHAIHRDKLALGSSLQTAPYRGWNRGRLGLPYYVSGRVDAERRGWVITMHAAGTAVRPRSGPAEFPVKPAVGMGAP